MRCIYLFSAMGWFISLALSTLVFSEERRWNDFSRIHTTVFADRIDAGQQGDGALKDEVYWRFSGNFYGEIQVDSIYGADLESEAITTVKPKLSAEIEVRFNENLSLVSDFVFKQVRKAEPGDDVFFDHLAGYVKKLKLSYNYQAFSFFAGKSKVDFGEAYDYDDSMWVGSYTGAYKITERLGAGVGYTTVGEYTGKHTVTVSGFFRDTTFLSSRLGVRGGHISKEDGGLSNTEDFSSFSITFRGYHNPDNSKFFSISNLTYAAGHAYQEAGDVDVTNVDQKSYFVNLGFDAPIAANWSLGGLFEYVDIQNVDGSAGSDTYYFTAIGTATCDENWSIVAGYTYRDVQLVGVAGSRDYLLYFSGIYDFGNGFSIESGWAHQEASVNNNKSLTVGTEVSYSIEF